MLNKIRDWFIRYDVEISWFFIGYFTSEFFQDIARGNLLGAAFDLILVVLNYTLVRGRR